MFCLCGCSQKEPSVVRTYEKTDSKEAFENTEPVIMVKHYEMSDGTRSEERRVGKECRPRWSP